MFTAESVIAKIVTFIIDKSGAKLLALPFDKKRRACRSLVKLYYCIQCLDDITEALLQSFTWFNESEIKLGVINGLNSHRYDLESATRMFMNLSKELYGGLDIIDPALARCCDVIYEGKFDFLTFVNDSIAWDRSTSPAKLKIKKPSGIMEKVNMEEMYEKAQSALRAGEDRFWPDSGFFDFSDDFQDVAIEDDEAAHELRDMIVRQNKQLKEAKERLRNLIKENFSIEEILFQSDTHPYR